MDNVLIKDKNLNGKYVVIKDTNDPEVISSGDDPKIVYEEAIKKGYNEPVILFVPKDDIVQIYLIQ
ncbi:DUF5678 domain-containing protein [Candidatus Margulisiibacteriota bacterium]